MSKQEQQEKKQKAVDAILDFFKENEDIFNECMEALDGWDGYLGDDRYFDMSELSEFYREADPIDLLNQAYFGYNLDSWHEDSHGERIYNSFNPNRDYFRYNGYGNLCSTDWKDYSDHLDNYAVEKMQKNRNHVDAINNNKELADLFDELEEVDA